MITQHIGGPYKLLIKLLRSEDSVLRKKCSYYEPLRNQTTMEDDMYQRCLRSQQIAKDFDRWQNQTRFMQRLCFSIKIFDHNLATSSIPECMRFYRDEKTRYSDLTFLRIRLDMQSKEVVEACTASNRFLLDENQAITDIQQIFFEELRLQSA